MDERLQSLINKGYDYNLVAQLSSYTREDIQKCISILMDQAKDIAKPSNSPHIYFIGGQPGSGKSSAIKRISKIEVDYGIVNVEMDAYRMMNPKIQQIKQAIIDFYKDKNFPNNAELMSIDFVAFTQKFADSIEDNYIVELFNNRYNMAIESTLRHPDKKLKLAQNMRQANPNCVVSVIMMGIPRDIALNGVISRAKQMDICLNKLKSDAKIKGIEITPIHRGSINQQFYDSICADLPGSIEYLSNPQFQHIFNGNIQIQDRKGYIHYDRNKDGLSKSASQIENSILNERINKMQIEETKQLQHLFDIESFIKENRFDIESIYGTLKNAKEIFKQEAQKIRELLEQQVIAYSKVVNYQPVILETNGRKI